jgi:site-specific DNA recombinase
MNCTFLQSFRSGEPSPCDHDRSFEPHGRSCLISRSWRSSFPADPNEQRRLIENIVESQTERSEAAGSFAFCADKRNQVDIVVVYDVSRFSRNAGDYHVLSAVLLTQGVHLRSVRETLSEKAEDQLVGGFMALFAEFDNVKRGERTVAGMKARLDKGGWPFPAPPGYVKGPDQTLKHDPVRAPLIAKAFKMYGTGLFQKQQVLDHVNELGLRTAKNEPMSQQTFDRVLSNAIYAGVMEVEVWGVSAVGAFEPIVDRDTFDTVQDVLAGRKPKVTRYQNFNPSFPLRRFVRCGVCGQRMSGSWSRGKLGGRYGYYCCPRSECRAISLRKEKLEKLFAEFLSGLQPNADLAALFKAAVIEVWRTKQADALDVRREKAKEAAELEKRRTMLVDALLKDKLDQATFDAEIALVRDKLATVGCAGDDDEPELEVESVAQFAEFVLLNMSKLWTGAPPDQKQRMQTLLFPDGVDFEDQKFRTPSMSLLFNDLCDPNASKTHLVTRPGLEPGTYGLKVRCSTN